MESNILSIHFNNHTPITDETELYILCQKSDKDSTLILQKADNRFYRSYICEKNTKIVSICSEITPFSHDDSIINIVRSKGLTVLILQNETADTLVFDNIRSIEHFVRYLKFAEMSMCNLSLLENCVAMDGIFVDMERHNEKRWKTNKILLTNIGFREFNNMHFNGVVPGAAAHAGYPNANPLQNPKLKKYLRKVHFDPIPEELYNNISSQTFNWLIEFLLKLDLMIAVRRIMRAFLLSFEYCHLALKCPLLNKVVGIYPELSGYMIYAMRILYLEEREKYGYGIRQPTMTHNERFVFTLDEVVGLPYYPKYNSDNPYFVEPGFGMTAKQQLTLPAYIKGDRGIYTRDEAISRLNEYTGGILENIKWNFDPTNPTTFLNNNNNNDKPIRTVLCGSAIPAIFIKNVLETYTESRSEYFQEYYPARPEKQKIMVNVPVLDKPLYTIESSEDEDDQDKPSATVRVDHPHSDSDDSSSFEEIAVDAIIGTDPKAPKAEIDLSGKPTIEQLERAHEHITRIKGWKLDNLANKIRDHIINSDFASATKAHEQKLMETIPKGFVDDKGKEELDEKPLDENENPVAADGEPIKNTMGFSYTKTPLTSDEKNQDNYTDIDLMVETEDFEIFDMVAQSHFEAIRESVSVMYRDRVYMKMLLTENKYKYKIYGLPRCVEIFMVGSIPGTISKFHLAPVRAWWDGDDLHMLPTFVTAAMTSVSYDMRWISCAKDLRDIVLKYFQRGFAPMINKDECRNILAYLNATPKWPTWTMPGGWGGWRAHRWANRPIYYNSNIFNPSSNNKGVYYGLNCPSRQIIDKLDYNIKISEYNGPQIKKSVSRSILRKKIVNPNKVGESWANIYK